MSAHIHQQSHEVLLQLEPPELGRLRIDLVLEGEKVQARILAEVAEAGTLLQVHLDELKTALRQHNLELSNVQVDVSGWDGGRDLPADSQPHARARDDRAPQPRVSEWSPPATRGDDPGQRAGIDLWV
ncbi:MAG: flagellar hook-length control protein FliK [Candidatus Binatia bacterium]|nr:flagellar hook-length control protein FliK [Candidatus Binatia bacterium]